MNQRGFTLIEVMIALLIFGLVLASMAPAFAAHMRANTNSEIKTGAIAAAQRVLDELRFDEVSDMPVSGSDSPTSVTVGDREYEATVSYCSDMSFCTSDRVRHLKVEISYSNQEIYELETVYTELE